MRDVVLAVREVDAVGRFMMANELLDLLAGQEVDPPGDVSIEDEEVRRKSLMGLGKRLSVVFKKPDRVEVDGLWFQRWESPDLNEHGKPCRYYRVTDGPPDDSVPGDALPVYGETHAF